jgi:hypothetical protein
MGIKTDLKENLVNQPKDSLVIIHQNIRGFMNKIEELNCSIVTRNIHPHLIYLSEHYMTKRRLKNISNLHKHISFKQL